MTTERNILTENGLHLTRDEADRLTADGRVVLFREGECALCGPDCGCGGFGRIDPPAEFEMQHVESGGGPNNGLDPADCHNGKRRVAVVVPCYNQDQHHLMRDCVQCSSNGLVTVGHVVVTWGPLVVVGRANTDWSIGEHIFEADWRRWVPGKNGPHPVGEPLTLPADVDPQSLVGQYALGIKKVE